MLLHLRVENLGLITGAEIDPSPGFTVITGETGAGKTLLLGGLRLLLGGDAKATAPNIDGVDTEIEGLIDTDGHELGVRRVIPAASRSRAYLDGSIASVEALTMRVGGAFEIVGQHDQHDLTRPRSLLGMIDSALSGEGKAAKDNYDSKWSELTELKAWLSDMGGDPSALARELDLHRFQAREIESAQLTPGEDDSLRNTYERLNRHVEIAELVSQLGESLGTISELAGSAVAASRTLSKLDESTDSLRSEAEELAIRSGELTVDVARYGDALTYDEAEHRAVEEHLNTIGDLKRKYGKTIDDILAFAAEAEIRASELESVIGESSQIEEKLAQATKAVADAGRELKEQRRKAATLVTKQATAHLEDVGFRNARIDLVLNDSEPGPSGTDKADLLFSSNAQLAPTPVGRGASGGELSRLVLAMRLATSSVDTKTLVFDEIDTGIGGQTANAMGEKLAALAEVSQVLCVTHLPQVAAHADRHYVVERGASGPAAVRLVEGEDRIAELTRMIGSLPESDAGRTAAAEMLTLAAK